MRIPTEPIPFHVVKSLHLSGLPPETITPAALTDAWAGSDFLSVAGLVAGAVAPVVAEAVSCAAHRRLLVVVKDQRTANLMVRDLCFYLGTTGISRQVIFLPELDVGPYDQMVGDQGSEYALLTALAHLLDDQPGQVVVTTALALKNRVIPRREFVSLSRWVEAGMTLEMESLQELLLAAGYWRARVVEEPGSFAVRGSLLDLFIPGLEAPLRVDFYGDEVESIRRFQPNTQVGAGGVDRFFVHPIKQMLRPDDGVWSGGMAARARELCDEVNVPTATTELLLEDMAKGRLFVGRMALLPVRFPALDTVWDYLGPVSSFVVDEEMVRGRLRQAEQVDLQRYRGAVDDGKPAMSPDAYFLGEQEVWAHICAGQVISTHQVAVEASQEGANAAGQIVTVATQAVMGPAGLLEWTDQKDPLGLISTLAVVIEPLLAEHWTVVVVARREERARHLRALFRDLGLAVSRSGASGSGWSPGLQVVVGDLALGHLWPAHRRCVISVEELSGVVHHRASKTTVAKTPLFDLANLKEGDLVVHRVHGIGRYDGLVLRRLGDRVLELISISYREGDKLYLPVYRADQLQRYASDGTRTATLDKLGGQTFANSQKVARRQAARMAAQLLSLYARKKLSTRPPVSPPDELYDMFTAQFPFVETPDQERVIGEVMSDLEKDIPMDRLVCGDVGFGKTEVAMRAAFRVAASGRQVAVLVPTTILAQQHYHSFCQRFEGYPMKVALMSRFISPARNKAVALELKQGRVDIVIGTHRLLTRDVHFKDLGLLVIDEEHRFGVAQKERIRGLKASVDTLSMTATPIPRSLHMAFSELRDLSIIATPPVNRIPIKTRLCHDSPGLIKEGIERELERAGQVYFVHNRVHDLEAVTRRIQRLVPGAKVAMGHGQMSKRALERVMRDFVAGKVDVLVCTSIVESGLDISRANTIFIDRADTMGLAQLYQIRGRVGRSDRQAVAYLLVPPLEMLSIESRSRLEVLVTHTSLGAGFAVASADLEIRGVGNLLGKEQSGHAAAVGYEMFMDLLKAETERLKGRVAQTVAEPEVTFDEPGRLPTEYLPEMGLRLHYYKEMATADSEEAVRQVGSELVDRFGALPKEARQLLDGMVVKALARLLKVAGVEVKGARMIIHLSPHTILDPPLVTDLIGVMKGRLMMTPDFKLVATLLPDGDTGPKRPMAVAISVLHRLCGCAIKSA